MDYVGASEHPQTRPDWSINDVAIGGDLAAAVAFSTAVSAMDTAYRDAST
jgi:hypothetical protein